MEMGKHIDTLHVEPVTADERVDTTVERIDTAHGSIPIAVDASVPEGEWQMRDADGTVLAAGRVDQ